MQLQAFISRHSNHSTAVAEVVKAFAKSDVAGEAAADRFDVILTVCQACPQDIRNRAIAYAVARPLFDGAEVVEKIVIPLMQKRVEDAKKELGEARQELGEARRSNYAWIAKNAASILGIGPEDASRFVINSFPTLFSDREHALRFLRSKAA